MGRLERHLDADKVAQAVALELRPHRHASNRPDQPRALPPLPAKPKKPRPAAYIRKLAAKKARRGKKAA